MLGRIICQCIYDEILSPSPTLHSRRDDPHFEPLPTKLAACPSYVHLTVEDDDDKGSTCQDRPSLLNNLLSGSTQSVVQHPFKTAHVPILSTLSFVSEHSEPHPTKSATCPSCVRLNVIDDDDEGPTFHDEPLLLHFSLSTQSAVQLPSGTAHVPVLSTLSSVPERLSDSTASTPKFNPTESSLLRRSAVEVGNISSRLSSLNHEKEPVLSNAQKPHSRSCVKKKKNRSRDASGTEGDNGRPQTKRKRGKGSSGPSVIPQTRVTDKASRNGDGTRSLERRVLEDITNKVLHDVT